jgi:hypothetical protein
MGNPKTTGQDYIDYYEKKKRDTGKTTASENLKYTKEKARQRNAALKEALGG